jgi:hypothetical protein
VGEGKARARLGRRERIREKGNLKRKVGVTFQERKKEWDWNRNRTRLVI